MQAAKPIRRYIMGSNHSFIGGLGENYAALGENWHINFQSPSLKKAKRKAYKRHKTACRLNFFGAAGGIRTLVGLLPNWFRVSPVMTTSIPLRVFFATSALKKYPGKRRELMERTTKIFLLDDTSKALKNQGFSKTVPKWSLVFDSALLWPLRYRCVYFSQHQPSKSTPEKGENYKTFSPWWYLQSLKKSRVFRKIVPKWSLVFDSALLWLLRYCCRCNPLLPRILYYTFHLFASNFLAGVNIRLHKVKRPSVT